MSDGSGQHAWSTLLARQIRRLLGGSVPPGMETFVASVDATYRQFDAERELMERSLELTSEELVERNRRLSGEVEAGHLMQAALQNELAERQRVEHELRRSLFRLGEARRIFGMGYWEANLATGEATWSDEMYPLFGYAPGEVKPSRQLFARHCYPQDLRRLTRAARFLRPGTPQEHDFRVRLRGGEERILRVSGMRTRDDNDSGGSSVLLGICHDITRQHRYERDLVDARERAEQAQRHAEELLRLKSSLLDNISHELRTPLAAIIGFADILSHDLSGEQREFAALIYQSGERLLDTFNSVLTLASFDSGNLQIDLKPVDLRAEASEAIAMLRQSAEQKGLALDLGAPGPVPVLADSAALHRILHNLVANAIKFTEAGSVCVRVYAEPSEEEGGARGVIEVTDTGIGIEESFLPYLFEPFHQQSKGMARAHEGAGLGLAIVKRLTEMMNGTLKVRSQVDVGTTFRVALPLHDATLRLVVGRRE